MTSFLNSINLNGYGKNQFQNLSKILPKVHKNLNFQHIKQNSKNLPKLRNILIKLNWLLSLVQCNLRLKILLSVWNNILKNGKITMLKIFIRKQNINFIVLLITSLILMTNFQKLLSKILILWVLSWKNLNKSDHSKLLLIFHSIQWIKCMLYWITTCQVESMTKIRWTQELILNQNGMI